MQEISFTALEPTLGREIQKTRPAVIIQNDITNRLTDMTIVAPIFPLCAFLLTPAMSLLPLTSARAY